MASSIRVRMSQKRKIDIKGVPANTWDSARRVNTPTTVYERAHPVEVGHLVFLTDCMAEMERFYCDPPGLPRLGSLSRTRSVSPRTRNRRPS